MTEDQKLREGWMPLRYKVVKYFSRTTYGKFGGVPEGSVCAAHTAWHEEYPGELRLHSLTCFRNAFKPEEEYCLCREEKP